jgi:hypothetical protein
MIMTGTRSRDVRQQGESDGDILRCAVKNCQKKLEKDEIVRVGTKIFCKSCAVFYFKTTMRL